MVDRLTYYTGRVEKRLADREDSWRACKLTHYAGRVKNGSAD